MSSRNLVYVGTCVKSISSDVLHGAGASREAYLFRIEFDSAGLREGECNGQTEG